MGRRPASERSARRQGTPICATSLAGVTGEVEEEWTSVPPAYLPATGGPFSIKLLPPFEFGFRGLRRDRRVDTHRFEAAVVVVLAVIATIVFVIAWPFWYIRRRYARERRPEIALEVLNQRYALGEIGRSEYLQNRDDILAAQVR